GSALGHNRETPGLAEVPSTGVTVDLVPRSHYRRIRTLLAIAITAAVVLAYAVGVLATAKRTTVAERSVRPAAQFDLSRSLAAAAAAAEPGARLDHAGRKWPLETGCKLHCARGAGGAT